MLTLPEALDEIKRIVEWYNEASAGLGDRFKKKMPDKIAAIKKAPLTRSYRYDEVRFAVVKKFPYAAHYTINKENHLIKIQAVFGFAQDSDANWKMPPAHSNKERFLIFKNLKRHHKAVRIPECLATLWCTLL